MHLTPEQSFIAQQATSILAQSETSPAHQPGAFCPGQCLHQPYSFGFQLPKANLSLEKGGKKESLLIHSTALKMNWTTTSLKNNHVKIAPMILLWRNCPMQIQMYLTKGEKGRQNYSSILKRFFWQKCKITTGGHFCLRGAFYNRSSFKLSISSKFALGNTGLQGLRLRTLKHAKEPWFWKKHNWNEGHVQKT